jgi:hypothetical protein
MIPIPRQSPFNPLSSELFQSNQSHQQDMISSSIISSNMLEEDNTWSSAILTQHHAKARILKELGVGRLDHLEDLGLDDGTHPICRLRDAHEPGSGFRLVTQRLDKFYAKFRLSCTAFER